MPKDQRSRKYPRRMKPYQRRRRTSRFPISKTDWLSTVQKTSPQRGVFGFPDEFTTRLRYCEVITLTSASNGVGKYCFRMNSIFDPDQTGTGHQPYYYDQLSALYGRYVVLGSKLTAEFAVQPSAIATAQPSGPAMIGVVSDDDASVGSTVSTLLEQQNSKTTLLGGGNSGPATKKLTLTFSPERELGLGRDDDTVGAAFGSNPSKQWYGFIFAAEAGASAATSIIVKVQIEYFVKLSQLTNVTGS